MEDLPDDSEHAREEPVFRVTWQGQAPAELLVIAGKWLQDHDPDAAFAFYDAALDLDATYSYAAYRAAHFALRLKRYEDAAEKAKLAAQLAPDHAPTWHLASVACWHLEQYESALSLGERALELAPQHPGALLQKLRSLAALTRWKDVGALYDSLGPELLKASEPHLWQALALVHLGRSTEAVLVYDRVSQKIRRRLPHVARIIDAAIST